MAISAFILFLLQLISAKSDKSFAFKPINIDRLDITYDSSLGTVDNDLTGLQAICAETVINQLDFANWTYSLHWVEIADDFTFEMDMLIHSVRAIYNPDYSEDLCDVRFELNIYAGADVAEGASVQQPLFNFVFDQSHIGFTFIRLSRTHSTPVWQLEFIFDPPFALTAGDYWISFVRPCFDSPAESNYIGLAHIPQVTSNPSLIVNQNKTSWLNLWPTIPQIGIPHDIAFSIIAQLAECTPIEYTPPQNQSLCAPKEIPSVCPTAAIQPTQDPPSDSVDSVDSSDNSEKSSSADNVLMFGAENSDKYDMGFVDQQNEANTSITITLDNSILVYVGAMSLLILCIIGCFCILSKKKINN